MFAYVASVTLCEHFMNALNAENVSFDLERAKNTISSVLAFVVSVVWGFGLVWFVCLVFFFLSFFFSHVIFCLRLFTYLR